MRTLERSLLALFLDNSPVLFFVQLQLTDRYDGLYPAQMPGGRAICQTSTLLIHPSNSACDRDY